jgi:hypothetical protein
VALRNKAAMLHRDARPPVAAAGTWPLFVAPPGRWLALLIPLVRALAGAGPVEPDALLALPGVTPVDGGVDPRE